MGDAVMESSASLSSTCLCGQEPHHFHNRRKIRPRPRPRPWTFSLLKVMTSVVENHFLEI